jgi:hypothetical protein
MSKIYSAVDEAEATSLIGKEVYYGDTLYDVKSHRNKCVLEGVRPEEFNYRFVVGDSNWNLIQEVPKATHRKVETLDEAEIFFGKVARNKDGTDIFTVVNACLLQGEILIGEWTAEELLEDYLIDGKPFGVPVEESINEK